MIVLDIDGTVTNSKKEVTLKTKVAIKKLQDKGVNIVIASGRPTYGIGPIVRELELDKNGGYVLSFNGAQIINCVTNEIIYNETLPLNMIGDIAHMAKKYDCETMSYRGNCVITTNPKDPFIQLESKISKLPIQQIADFHAYDECPVNKCIVTQEDSHLEKVEKIFAKEYEGILNIFRSESFFLEVMPLNIDKAVSLGKLIEHLGISRDEVVACGDGYNDISMVEFAGMGVAMDNAQQQVKDVANFVTKSNDEDGIAYAIEKLWFN